MKKTWAIILALIMVLLSSSKSKARTIVVPYNPAVMVSTDGTTLTFFNNSNYVEADYSIETEYNESPAWCSTKVTKVVFDSSFHGCYPSNTAYWFSGCSNLKTIEGIENLRVDSVKKANYMFYGCKELVELDLSGWNTYKLTGFQNMFAGCSKLTTIYGNAWSLLDNMTTTERQEFLIWQMHHTEDSFMFDGCISLIGGSGTKYDATIKNKDYEYCHVDEGIANPGFFTCKPAPLAPYAVLDNDVLTLYYDNKRYGHMGTKYEITFGEAPNYGGNIAIKEIHIDASMSNIKPTTTAKLFTNCYEVVAIRNIENLNTSDVKDMSFMFSNCCSLGAADLSGLNTTNVTNMSGLFYQCFSLNYVNLDGLNTSKVTDMSSMFYRCMSLSSLDLSSLVTQQVTTMKSMFCECRRLRMLNITGFSTGNVTDMSNMFSWCSYLTKLDTSSFDTSNVTDMSYMFNYCSSLQNLTLSNFNTAKVTNMAFMFGHPLFSIGTQIKPSPVWQDYYFDAKSKIEGAAEQLKTLDISSFSTANVTNMESMFECLPMLTTIYVGNSWSTAMVSNGSNMFRYSKDLLGGSGTTYDGDHVDQLYAHIDGGISDPGYLTLKGSQSDTGVKEAYAMVNGSRLTFYYDNLKSRRNGTKYDLNATFSATNLPGWTTTYAGTITEASIHSSMKEYCPNSTAYWFYGLKNISTIEGMRNLNTSEVTDMSGMFSKCTKLENLDLSAFNTAKVNNMHIMFGYCPSLTSLDLRPFNTSQVTAMDSMFIEDTALKSIDLSSFNTSNVKNFKFMFYTCRALENLDVTHFNTAKATTMRQMFMRCSTIKTLELRNFNTTNVTDMHAMFYECEALTSLDISTFDTRNVTNMYAMFYKCKAVPTLDVSGFSTGNVTDMAWMFAGCDALTSLCLSGFNTANVTTMRAMFNACYSLTTIFVKDDWNTSKVTDSSYLFTGCTSLVGGNGTIYNSSNVSHAFAKIDGGSASPGYFTSLVATIPSGLQPYAIYNGNTLTFYYDNKANSRTGTKYVIADSYSNTNLPRWILDYYRRTFTKAVFDASFASYRPTSTAYWFYNCTAMTAIEGIANLNTSKVTSMAEMFRFCSVLNNLDLRSFDTSNVTDMSCMFCYCRKLTNLNISSFNTAKVTTMSHLFHQCPLSSINVNSFNTTTVTDMSLMFAECKKLQTLNLESFNTTKVTDMTYMFLGNDNLTTIYASDKWSTEHVVAGDFMFYGDTKLVGGRGTKYTSEHIDQEYARIDGGCCNPGYLTGDYVLGPLEAYVNIVDTVMTFYYDDMRSCRQGETYLVGQRSSYILNGFKAPTWYHASLNLNSITWVNFDKSFADFRPTSTSCWFSDMSNLKLVSNIANLNTSETTEMGSMFSSCYNLQYLDLSFLKTSKVTTMDMMFYSCMSLEVLNGLDTWNTSSITDMKNMFRGCSSLRNLNLSKFDTSKVTDMRYMFIRCASLTSLNVSSFDTSNLTSMEGIFSGCRSLTSLDVSSFHTGNVTNMEGLFSGCSSLTNLDLSSFDTSNVTNMSVMFADCSSLTSLDLSGFDTSNVLSMVGMFSGCSSLTSLNLNGFDTKNVTYFSNLFNDCKSLTSLDLSSFDTRKVENMWMMFWLCSSLKTIYVGDRWSTDMVVEPTYMFAFCNNLVGGEGTVYDTNHLDKEYAHIDGGISNPGYLTRKTYVEGDVNGDGKVTPADAIMILYHYFNVVQNGFNDKVADLNHDGSITPADAIEALYRYFGTNDNSGARAARPTVEGVKVPE
jgi:surface protein